MAEAHSPLEQFHIKRLVDLQIGGVDISFTNSSLWMFIAIAAVTLFLTLGSRNRALVPGRGQSMAEMSYEFVANMLRDNVGSEGRKYFPFIFTLFMFVLFANLAGMLPYSFTTTSHIVVTFAMALFVWMLKVLAGFIVALGIAGVAPLVVVVGLTALELFIAALQAYVFAILTCIYLNDALHLH